MIDVTRTMIAHDISAAEIEMLPKARSFSNSLCSLPR